MRAALAVVIATLAVAGCTSAPPPDELMDYYWVTDLNLDDTASCLVGAMDGAYDGYTHEIDDLLPGQYLEVRPQNASVMGGGDLYYVGVSRYYDGASMFLHGYGVATDVIVPAVEVCS